MAEVDSLSIKISASSTEAATAIGNLATELGRLKEQFKGGMGSSQFKTLITNLTDLAKVAKEMDGSMVALSKAAKAVERLSAIGKVRIPKNIGDGIRSIGLAAEMVTPDAIANLDSMTRSLQRLANVDLKGVSSALRAVGRTATATPAAATSAASAASKAPRNIMGALFDKSSGGALSGFGKFTFDGITAGLKKVISLAKEAGRWLKKLGQRIVVNIKANTVDRLRDKLKGVQNIFRSFGRIAYYRLIRSAIKAVTQAFSEGLKNAYLFSEGLSNAVDGRIAVALDALTSSALKMKNQLGAAFGSLLTAIAPVLQTIIAMVTNLANAITQLLAAFTGATFLRAKDVSAKFSDDMAKGAGSAKEWKNQLMGFDVINRLEEPSQGGSGSGKNEIDPATMFEVTEINTAIRNFVEDFKAAINAGKWKEAGQLLGEKINGVVRSIKWEEIGTKLGRAFGGAISVMYNALKTTDFITLGKNVAKFLSNALEEINFADLGALLVRKFTLAVDFFIGFIGRFPWSGVGEAVGEFLKGALKEANSWLEDKDWEDIGSKIRTGIADFFKSAKTEELSTGIREFFKNAATAAFDVIEGLFPDGIIPTVAQALIKLLCDAVDYLTSEDFEIVSNVFWYRVTKSLFGPNVAGLLYSSGDYAGKEIVTGMMDGYENKSPEFIQAIIAFFRGNGKNKSSLFDQIDLMTPHMETKGIALAWYTVRGFISGLFSNKNDLDEAAKDVLGDAPIEAAESELQINSPSKVFEGIGENTIQGFIDGMNSMNASVSKTLSNIFGGIIEWCQNAHLWIQNVFDGLNLLKGGGVLNWIGSKISGITGRAAGGFVPNGELFVAREAGPELVGTIGNQTAVANNQQIIEGIKEGVFEAVVSAMSGNSGGNQPIVIMMDGKEIARTTTKYQNQMARAY